MASIPLRGFFYNSYGLTFSEIIAEPEGAYYLGIRDSGYRLSHQETL